MTNALAPTRNKAKTDEVIALVLEGNTLKAAVSLCGLTLSAFNHMLSGDKEAALAYIRATEIRADVLADEALTIADNENDAAKARNQIQVRQWLASKLHSKRYGDRVDLNVTQTIDVGATLAEARARLLPVRDQQIVDVVATRIDTGVAGHGPNDNESLSPAQVPDIFS